MATASDPAAMVRDGALRAPPHHEAARADFVPNRQNWKIHSVAFAGTNGSVDNSTRTGSAANAKTGAPRVGCERRGLSRSHIVQAASGSSSGTIDAST